MEIKLCYNNTYILYLTDRLMDYTIRVSMFFKPKAWMVDKKIRNFLRKRKEGDLVLLIDDKVPNLAPLLTIFKEYDQKKAGEFIGENPVYLLAPTVEYNGLRKIITPRIKNPEEVQHRKEAQYREGGINYVPERFYYGTNAVDALRNEEGHNMKEFRIYAELIEKDMIRKIAKTDWDYYYNLWKEFKQDRITKRF